MGRNLIAKFLTIVVLCVTGCAKSGLEAARKDLIYNQAQRSPRAALLDSESPQILPSTHFAAGRMFEAQGHYAQAIEQYAKTIAVNHGHVAAHHRLGLMYSKLERHDEAIQMFRKAVALKPDNAVLHNNLGFELMFMKDWNGAIGQFAEAIAVEPDFARAQINMGMTLSKLERFDEALEHFRAVLPEPDAQYNLGLMYRSAQRYDDAAKSFKCILDADPNFQAAQTQLADIAPHLPPTARPGVDVTIEVPTLGDSRQDALDDMEPCDDQAVEPDRRDVVVEHVRPEPKIVSPSTTWRIADDPNAEQAVARFGPSPETEPLQHEIDRELASLADENWLSHELFGEAVEIASSTEPFDLLGLEKPCKNDRFIGTETADGFVVPAEGVVVPVSAVEAAAPSEAIADALSVVPFGRLNDEVERIDDEIRCLIDEALEAMALVTREANASDAVYIDPVVIEPAGESIIGDFVADSTEPIKYPPLAERPAEVVVPTTDTFELWLPEDRRSDPVAVDSSPIEKTVPAAEPPMPERDEAQRMPWRSRLNSLSANLVALRDEINCLEAANVNAADAQEPVTTPVATTTVAAQPKAGKGAHTAPKRVTRRKRSSSDDPGMMLAYKPTKAPSILAAPRPRSTSTVREPRNEPPAALARPAEASAIFPAVEIGPAFPAPRIGPAFGATERDEIDWDSRFGDLHDLLSITENEIRCWEEVDQVREEGRLTDDARPEPKRRKTHVTPVRFRPQHNPFYNK